MKQANPSCNCYYRLNNHFMFLNNYETRWLNLYYQFWLFLKCKIYGWRIVYLSNARIQAYCPVFDHPAKRTMPSMQPANWEAISNSKEAWQTIALLPCQVRQKDKLVLIGTLRYLRDSPYYYHCRPHLCTRSKDP